MCVENKHVFDIEKSKHLESRFRKFFQNPKRLFKKYIIDCMSVLDFGCGPGFFSIEIAKLKKVKKVISVDLQKGMLDIISKKIIDTDIKQKIELVNCTKTEIGYFGKVDMIVAFYVLHEVPDSKKILSDFFNLLNPGGILYVAEPKHHVNKNDFNDLIGVAKEIGFNIIKSPWVIGSFAAVFRK